MIALPLREWEVLAFMRENHTEQPVRLSALPRKWHRPLGSLAKKTLLVEQQVVGNKGCMVTVYSAFAAEYYRNIEKLKGRCNETYNRTHVAEPQ